MSTLNGKLLLAVTDEVRKAHYLKVLHEHGVACCVVQSLKDAVTHAAQEPHCGILFDMKLMIKIHASKKSLFEDLLNGLPSASLNIGASSGDIRILPRGTMASACTSLDQFINVCAQFIHKNIISKSRETFHYNVLLALDCEFSEPCRTVCIDSSDEGCFLFYGNEDIAIGDTVWLRFPDTFSNTTVKAVVCWVRVWGTTQHIPGFGVFFENLHQTELQNCPPDEL